MKRRPHAAFYVLALVASFSSSIGCARSPHDRPSPPACAETDGGHPVDPALLAFLSKARSAHHIADAHEESNDPAGAIAVLEDLLKGPMPGGASPAPEAREVLADTRARIAELDSRLGRFDAAAQHVEQGLGLARETTYFRGHLFEVRGLLEERRSKSLREKGDVSAAELAKQRALEAFEQSMKVQEQVIDQAVPDGGRR